MGLTLREILKEKREKQQDKKEKQINELVNLLDDNDVSVSHWDYYNDDFNKTYRKELKNVAKIIINAGYLKIDKDSVVLSREELNTIQSNFFDSGIKYGSKETAEKILNDIGNHLKRYSHIHKHAEEAKKSTEEYADGTPIEMESVWDTITLSKNGYADYETMNELQDNIENIALSRLLQEFEKDFRLYAKQFGVGVK